MKSIMCEIINQYNKNGKQHGLWKNYYSGHGLGALSSEGNYVNGNRHGLWKDYYLNGVLYSIGRYADGKMGGLWKYYHPDGDLKTEIYYV